MVTPETEGGEILSTPVLSYRGNRSAEGGRYAEVDPNTRFWAEAFCNCTQTDRKV